MFRLTESIVQTALYIESGECSYSSDRPIHSSHFAMNLSMVNRYTWRDRTSSRALRPHRQQDSPPNTQLPPSEWKRDSGLRRLLRDPARHSTHLSILKAEPDSSIDSTRIHRSNRFCSYHPKAGTLLWTDSRWCIIRAIQYPINDILRSQLGTLRIFLAAKVVCTFLLYYDASRS